MGQVGQPEAVKASGKEEPKAATSKETPLYAPLVVMEVEQVDPKKEDAEDRERRLRRVIGRQRRPEGTVVGTLVHAAIRRWRFPGDAGLDELLRAEALMEGLVDLGQYDLTVAQAKALLNRFRGDARFAEIDAAERFHEVPYSRIMENSVSTTRVIDLVYRKADKWQIVDFKTDEIEDGARFSALKEKYTPQVVRYREDFQRLVGQAPESWLCFMNYANSVRWERVQ